MGSDLVSSRLRSRLLLAVRAMMNRNVEGDASCSVFKIASSY